jgi:hypothetical protein
MSRDKGPKADRAPRIRISRAPDFAPLEEMLRSLGVVFKVSFMVGTCLSVPTRIHQSVRVEQDESASRAGVSGEAEEGSGERMTGRGTRVFGDTD